VRFGTNVVSHTPLSLPRRRLVTLGVVGTAALALTFEEVSAQTIESRHWQGTVAMTRQPEHLVANTQAEWRSLWSRVGAAPPDVFEPGRMNAVGIFLGRRASEGYSVNVLSTTRRRDRIVVVFEERMPPDIMMAQRASPAPRPIAGGGGFGGPAAGFAPPGTGASLAPSAVPARPVGQPTSPWAIVLINRADLPISVEQRLFR
jgi:PrcB C-terminal